MRPLGRQFDFNRYPEKNARAQEDCFFFLRGVLYRSCSKEIGGMDEIYITLATYPNNYLTVVHKKGERPLLDGVPIEGDTSFVIRHGSAATISLFFNSWTWPGIEQMLLDARSDWLKSSATD